MLNIPGCTDPCALTPCLNGGTCIGNPGYQNFTCLCPPSCSGNRCQHMINVCAIDSEYGECTDRLLRYYYNPFLQRCVEFVYSGSCSVFLLFWLLFILLSNPFSICSSIQSTDFVCDESDPDRTLNLPYSAFEKTGRRVKIMESNVFASKKRSYTKQKNDLRLRMLYIFRSFVILSSF